MEQSFLWISACHFVLPVSLTSALVLDFLQSVTFLFAKFQVGMLSVGRLNGCSITALVQPTECMLRLWTAMHACEGVRPARTCLSETAALPWLECGTLPSGTLSHLSRVSFLAQCHPAGRVRSENRVCTRCGSSHVCIRALIFNATTALSLTRYCQAGYAQHYALVHHSASAQVHVQSRFTA